MNNSFYIYSKKHIVIERLHICTWDIAGANTRIEIGIEICNPKDSLINDTFDLSIHFPFSIDKNKIHSLHTSLCDEKNSRYIFNDIISSSNIIDEDTKRGKILHFKERGDLAIIPANFTCISDNELSFSINPKSINSNLYLRVIVEKNINTISTEKKGIAKKNYIFDFKINERRNIPENLVTHIDSADLLKINQVFLFHVVPDTYNIEFYDSNKFKSIRKIEKEVFASYTGIKELDKSEHVILFNKDSSKESYSFYTNLSNEVIGNKQIILAIGANILCSLLFSIPGLRTGWKTGIEWYCQFPWEWCIALIILFFLLAYTYRK